MRRSVPAPGGAASPAELGPPAWPLSTAVVVRSAVPSASAELMSLSQFADGTKLGGVVDTPLCCHSARPGQAGELGREEPAEVQQGQGQGPAPGEEQPQAPVQAGADLLESSSAERDWECWGTTG